MPEFAYTDLLPTGEDKTPYRLITKEGVSTFEADGRTFLKVEPEALRKLAEEAIHDIQHYLRPAHLAQLRRIIDDPEASGNDKFVALDLLKNAKYASAHYLDEIPAEGSELGHGFRDKDLEQKVFELTQKIGIGAQFGGKYFCHDVRVVRLPRHGASCPVAIAVSCSADRQALGKITRDGIFLEQLETDPARYLPDTTEEHLIQGGEVVRIDLNRPMADILAELGKHPVKTRLSLTGP